MRSSITRPARRPNHDDRSAAIVSGDVPTAAGVEVTAVSSVHGVSSHRW